MNNVFDKYEEKTKERPVVIDFALSEKDILKILKGTEYNQTLMLGSMDNVLCRIHARVFLKDKVKTISWENWRQILHVGYENPYIREIIEKIENE